LRTPPTGQEGPTNEDGTLYNDMFGEHRVLVGEFYGNDDETLSLQQTPIFNKQTGNDKESPLF